MYNNCGYFFQITWVLHRVFTAFFKEGGITNEFKDVYGLMARVDGGTQSELDFASRFTSFGNRIYKELTTKLEISDEPVWGDRDSNLITASFADEVNDKCKTTADFIFAQTQLMTDTGGNESMLRAWPLIKCVQSLARYMRLPAKFTVRSVWVV